MGQMALDWPLAVNIPMKTRVPRLVACALESRAICENGARFGMKGSQGMSNLRCSCYGLVYETRHLNAPS